MSKTIITESDLNYRDNGYIDYIEGEVWKTLENFPAYIFSNQGRVFSLYHRKLLKPYFCPFRNNKNYYYVKLKDRNGNFCGYKLHKIIAMCFCQNPLNKTIIHHKDGNGLNNKADNLMWVTFPEHMALHRELKKAKKAKADNAA